MQRTVIVGHEERELPIVDEEVAAERHRVDVHGPVVARRDRQRLCELGFNPVSPSMNTP